jgi:hypothetical protein
VTAGRDGGRTGLAVVYHLDGDGAVAHFDPDARLAGGRVAQHVGQALLDDAVSGVADSWWCSGASPFH